MAAAQAHELQEVDGQVGTMTLALDGSVLSATGELEGGAAASTVLHLLQDVNGIMTLQNNNALGSPHDTFKRLTVTFEQFTYALTIVNDKILVVKKANPAL